MTRRWAGPGGGGAKAEGESGGKRKWGGGERGAERESGGGGKGSDKRRRKAKVKGAGNEFVAAEAVKESESSEKERRNGFKKKKGKVV